MELFEGDSGKDTLLSIYRTHMLLLAGLEEERKEPPRRYQTPPEFPVVGSVYFTPESKTADFKLSQFHFDLKSKLWGNGYISQQTRSKYPRGQPDLPTRLRYQRGQQGMSVVDVSRETDAYKNVQNNKSLDETSQPIEYKTRDESNKPLSERIRSYAFKRAKWSTGLRTLGRHLDSKSPLRTLAPGSQNMEFASRLRDVNTKYDHQKPVGQPPNTNTASRSGILHSTNSSSHAVQELKTKLELNNSKASNAVHSDPTIHTTQSSGLHNDACALKGLPRELPLPSADVASLVEPLAKKVSFDVGPESTTESHLS